jgi:hypothetical protein
MFVKILMCVCFYFIYDEKMPKNYKVNHRHFQNEHFCLVVISQDKMFCKLLKIISFIYLQTLRKDICKPIRFF